MGRNLTHLALMLDELIRLKVPLIVSSQSIDISSANQFQRGFHGSPWPTIALGVALPG